MVPIEDRKANHIVWDADTATATATDADTYNYFGLQIEYDRWQSKRFIRPCVGVCVCIFMY